MEEKEKRIGNQVWVADGPFPFPIRFLFFILFSCFYEFEVLPQNAFSNLDNHNPRPSIEALRYLCRMQYVTKLGSLSEQGARWQQMR